MDRVGRGQVGVHPLASDGVIRSQGRDVEQGQAGLRVEHLAHDLGDNEPLRVAALIGHLELEHVAAGNDSGCLGVAQAGPHPRTAGIVPLARRRTARAPRPRRTARRAAIRRREGRSRPPGWLSPHRRRRRTHRRRRRPCSRWPPGHRRLLRCRPQSRRWAATGRLHGRLEDHGTAAGSCTWPAAVPRVLAPRCVRHGARDAAHAPGEFQVNPR